ncbi:MAG: hypothetical protein LBP65_01720 [Puniceicoccales bacterium]|jgi:hypothetical protein|nr:hypothetical protein [Puniceicoccales bacterium]
MPYIENPTSESPYTDQSYLILLRENAKAGDSMMDELRENREEFFDQLGITEVDNVVYNEVLDFFNNVEAILVTPSNATAESQAAQDAAQIAELWDKLSVNAKELIVQLTHSVAIVPGTTTVIVSGPQSQSMAALLTRMLQVLCNIVETNNTMRAMLAVAGMNQLLLGYESTLKSTANQKEAAAETLEGAKYKYGSQIVAGSIQAAFSAASLFAGSAGQAVSGVGQGLGQIATGIGGLDSAQHDFTASTLRADAQEFDAQATLANAMANKLESSAQNIGQQITQLLQAFVSIIDRYFQIVNSIAQAR